MHEPRPSETSTWPGSLEHRELTHPDHGLRRHHRQAQPRRAAGRRRPGRGREGTRPSSPRPRRRGSESSSSAASAARGLRSASTVATSAPSMSVAVAGGVGSISMPVMLGERVDVGGADDVADLAERRTGATSSSGSTPSMRQSASASAGGTSSSTVPACRRRSAEHDPGDSAAPGGPAASTASANGSARAFGTEMSTDRPSMRDSAVDAVPEPMLASSRRASSWSSVYVAQRVLSQAVTRAEDVVEGVAVDDQGDLAVGQHGGAGERGVLGDLRRQRPRDELALAERACVTVTAQRAGGGRGRSPRRPASGGGRAAEPLGGVDDREHAVAHDQHAAAGDRADRVVGERGPCARCGRAGSRTGGRRPRRAARP